MKKILYIICFITISCSLDIPVEDEITGLDAIDNVAIANEALSSIYIAYPKNKIDFSILADDFYPNHTIDDNKYSYNLYHWKTAELISLSKSIWAEYYSTINKANVLLNRIPFIKTTNKKEKKELQYIHAQTLCLKAYAFFELIEIYTPTYNETKKNELGIILKNKIASEELPRSTIENSYKETESILLQAIALFDEGNKTVFRFSKRSAKALLAKIYMNWNKYEKAIKLCNELIATSTINKTSFTAMWQNLENKDEVLLAFENTSSYFSSIYDSNHNNDEYYINRLITLTADDIRKESSFITKPFRMLDNSVINVNHLGKYRTKITDTEPTPIAAIRIAELYFIKAECLYKLRKNTEAITTINNLLLLRKASTPIVTITEMLTEKQKEFLGEGIRYFDSKRNKIKLEKVDYKKNQAIYKINSTDFRWQLPIPPDEIKQNKNIHQNKDWDKYI